MYALEGAGAEDANGTAGMRPIFLEICDRPWWAAEGLSNPKEEWS